MGQCFLGVGNTPVFLLGGFCGERRLVGYPWLQRAGHDWAQHSDSNVSYENVGSLSEKCSTYKMHSGFGRSGTQKKKKKAM